MSTTTTELTIPLGAPCWMDLVTSDPDKAAAFYTALFGWTSNEAPPEFNGYRYFLKDGQAVGGMMRNDPSFNMPDAWSIFLKTDDARRTEEKAVTGGGQVLMPTMDVFSNGSFTVLRDAGGATISAWQPGSETGFGVLMKDGTPCHFELHTRDYEATLGFYETAFGWTPYRAADEPDFRYATFSSDLSNGRAGIMDADAFLPEGTPAHWSVYISSGDIDTAVKRVQELGGSLVMGIDDTPYGRLATVSDPTGTIFKLRG